MSRTTQFIGLNSEALEFISKNNGKLLCKYEGNTGMFDEPLMYGIYEVEIPYKYYDIQMTRKETYVEITQAEPWSSGPCIFTCLKYIISDKYVGLWSDEEINNC